MDRFKIKKRRFPKDFKKISNFLKRKKGVKVRLGETTEFLGPFNRQVIIHHNYDLRNNGLYMLLHESGKVFQPQLSGINEYRTIDKKLHKDKYITGEILSKLDAWDTGRKIATQLDIPIDDEKWKEQIYISISKVLENK